MKQRVDFSKYQNFVDAVTSDASKDFLALSDRMVQLDEKGANIERLLTASVGINAEGGEFLEIVKKMVEKEEKLLKLNEDLKAELFIDNGNVCKMVEKEQKEYSKVGRYPSTSDKYKGLDQFITENNPICN